MKSETTAATATATAMAKTKNSDIIHHVKFEKMKSSSQNIKKQKRWRELQNLKFNVTEKIHGANFAIVLSLNHGIKKPSLSMIEEEDVQIDFAKRTGIIDEDDDFYKFRSQGIAEKLKGPAISAYLSFLKQQEKEKQQKQTKKDSECSSNKMDLIMNIYGELFGGFYPHDDVDVVDDSLKPVQSGVYYTPNLNFIAFDISIHQESNSEGEIPKNRRYLEWKDAQTLMENHGILFAQTLLAGATLEECTSFNIEFDSTIPKLFGLPPLELGCNAAEGIVIRSEQILDDGTRWISKRKIDKFCEVQYNDKTLGRAHRKDMEEFKEKNRKKKQQEKHQHQKQDDPTTLMYEALAMVTKQRLDNVISKIGHIDLNDKKMVRGVHDDLYEDIMSDMKEEFDCDYEPNSETRTKIYDACKELIGNEL